MLGIFNDERRSHGPIGPDPFRTGRFFAHAASRPAYVGPATWRRPLLPWAKNRSRHSGVLIVNRP
jgi:hypothetical protein